MNRPFRTRTAGLLVVAGLTGLARPAAADPIPTLPIVLQITDHRHVPLNIVTRAADEVVRIYREAGVNIIWIDPLRSSGTSDPGFALVVVPGEMSGKLTVETKAVAGDALGLAVGTREHRGRVAYVFYNRVERIARTRLNMSRQVERDDIDTLIVLAHVIAHEIGHLLLPYGHSSTGLMRADWNAKDLRLAADGRLNFTSEQAELIRGGLLTRAAR